MGKSLPGLNALFGALIWQVVDGDVLLASATGERLRVATASGGGRADRGWRHAGSSEKNFRPALRGLLLAKPQVIVAWSHSAGGRADHPANPATIGGRTFFFRPGKRLMSSRPGYGPSRRGGSRSGLPVVDRLLTRG